MFAHFSAFFNFEQIDVKLKEVYHLP